MGNFEERRNHKEKLAKFQAIENLLEAFKTNVRVRADGANWERENIDDYIERIKKILESDFR